MNDDAKEYCVGCSAGSRVIVSLIAALTAAGRLEPITRALGDNEMTAMMAEVDKRGDAARGEAIYQRANLLCATCHAIGGAGGVIGPDVLSVGASAPVDYIIESLLEPSKKIKEGYHTTQVTKKNGDVLTGGLMRDGGGGILLSVHVADCVLHIERFVVAGDETS